MGLSAEAAKNCAESCHTECLTHTEGFITVESLGLEYRSDQNMPMYDTVIKDVSGPLVDCKFGGPEDCPSDSPPGFVCLVSCCAHKFYDMAFNCEEAKGIGIIMYNFQNCPLYQALELYF